MGKWPSRMRDIENENARLRCEVATLKEEVSQKKHEQGIPGRIGSHESPVDSALADKSTENKHAGHAFLEREFHLQFLANNLPDGMFYQLIMDSHGQRHFTYISAGVESIHGITPEQVYADPMLLYGQIYEADRPTLLASEEVAMREAMPFSAEVRFRKPNGELGWILLRSNPRQLAEGSTVWDGVEIDISDRKRAEELLQQQTDEISQLMKSMANAFVVWGTIFDENNQLTDIRFDYFNDAYANVSGLTLSEVKGKTVRKVWPTTEESWYRTYEEVALTGKPKTFEMYHAPTNGLYSCRAYRPWDNRERVCCVFENITERRHAEETIRASQSFLDTVFEQSPHSMYITDDKGVMIRVNQACRDLFHVTNEDLVGKYNFFEDDIIREKGLVPLLKQVFEHGSSHWIMIPPNFKHYRFPNQAIYISK